MKKALQLILVFALAGLAFSGGPRGDAYMEALDAIEPRLRELLPAGG